MVKVNAGAELVETICNVLYQNEHWKWASEHDMSMSSPTSLHSTHQIGYNYIIGLLFFIFDLSSNVTN